MSYTNMSLLECVELYKLQSYKELIKMGSFEYGFFGLCGHWKVRKGISGSVTTILVCWKHEDEMAFIPFGLIHVKVNFPSLLLVYSCPFCLWCGNHSRS